MYTRYHRYLSRGGGVISEYSGDDHELFEIFLTVVMSQTIIYIQYFINNITYYSGDVVVMIAW